jgi:hypothetical protein
MARFAIMDGDIVSNIAIADEPLEANWIELDDGDAVDIGDIWVQSGFDKPQLNADSVIADNREYRNAMLLMTDWTQLPDVELGPEKKAEFATYRQALRAVDLENPVWPEKPAEKDVEEVIEEAPEEAPVE